MMDFEGLRRFLRIPRRRAGSQAADDVEAEIRFHLESRAAELEAGGLFAEEARRRAEAEFGDVQGSVRSLRRLARRTERDRRRVEWLSGLREDLVQGWRRLRSTPGFTLAAVLTLALGIGATTAVFSGVHGVLLRPLPFPEPDRLVKLWETTPDGARTNVVSSGNYNDWKEQATTFEELGAHSWLFGMTLTGDEDPVRVGAAMITPSALRALGVGAGLGRTFAEAEGRPGAEPVVLIGHGLWQSRFGADPAVVGRPLELDGQSATVVGVMPPGFEYPDPDVDVWFALSFDEEEREERRSHEWNVVGRLADGVPLERARAEMDAVAARLAEAHPEHMTGWGVHVLPLQEDIVGEVRGLLLVLFGVVGVVLLLTCVNLANLLLTRATAREREIAVRGALGADRWRLVRQLLVESLVLGILGGGIGLLVLALGLDALVALAPDDIPRLDEVRVDGWVLAFAAGTTLLATLLFGLMPALRATASRPQASLRAHRDSGGVAHRRLRSGLLGAEVALAVILVVGAGLLTRSMVRLLRVDPGFETERVLAMTVVLPAAGYGAHDEQVEFFRTLLDRVRNIPGVDAASGTSEPPLMGFGQTFSYAIEGRPSGTPSGREDDERLLAVSPGFFDALGIPILEGRAIGDGDRADAPRAAVISRSLARKQWPGGGAVGSRIRFREGQPWFEIVGVVADVHLDGPNDPAPPTLYIPFAQKPWGWMRWQTLVVRTSVDPESVIPAVRREILALDPNLVPAQISTLEERYAADTARHRFVTVLLGGFAAIALLLGALGIYGLLAYSVAQRRREIGIRLALGALPDGLTLGFVRDALLVVLAGLAVGGAAAVALTGTLEGLLFQVEPTDPLTFAASSAVLLAVAAVAAWLPAREASKVDPVRTMREV